MSEQTDRQLLDALHTKLDSLIDDNAALRELVEELSEKIDNLNLSANEGFTFGTG